MLGQVPALMPALAITIHPPLAEGDEIRGGLQGLAVAHIAAVLSGRLAAIPRPSRRRQGGSPVSA